MINPILSQSQVYKVKKIAYISPHWSWGNTYSNK